MYGALGARVGRGCVEEAYLAAQAVGCAGAGEAAGCAHFADSVGRVVPEAQLANVTRR